MNKAARIFLLILFILFLAVHYFIMGINKEYFPFFAHFYPFVAKVWFEMGRAVLLMNAPWRLEQLFYGLKMLFLFDIAIALLAFKNDSFYRATLWLAVLFFACYFLLLLILGLSVIYPIYTVVIGLILAAFLLSLKNNYSQTSSKNFQ